MVNGKHIIIRWLKWGADRRNRDYVFYFTERIVENNPRKNLQEKIVCNSKNMLVKTQKILNVQLVCGSSTFHW